MHTNSIRQQDFFRVLLTEVAPYETPINYSNWGSYNFYKNIKNAKNPLLQKIFRGKKDLRGIPFDYKIRKDDKSTRLLSILHPLNTSGIVELYEKHDGHILNACRKSTFTLRAPSQRAKCYISKAPTTEEIENIEEINAESAYASSYFAYAKFSHLYKFFESEEFLELEKRHKLLLHLDISKCFPSIYTHTISWAIKGKRLSKRLLNEADKKNPPFDTAFDTLIQRCNYGETHGIPIGPELCRIFAEIILQHIDRRIEERMDAKSHKHLIHYTCQRYIDDYFIFSSSHDILSTFRSIAAEELQQFKLYFSDSKDELKIRPFTSDISNTKVELSNFINRLQDTFTKPRRRHSRSINELRCILAGAPKGIQGCSAFVIKCLLNQITSRSQKNLPLDFRALYTYVELACYVLRIDTSVSTSYKFATLILQVLEASKTIEIDQQTRLKDKICHELHQAITASLISQSSTEALNLLILLSEDSLDYQLPKTELDTIIRQIEDIHQHAPSSPAPKLNYFEIVTLLYVARHPYADSIIPKLVQATCDILKDQDPGSYSEAAHLLLDCMSCPHLPKQSKLTIATAALAHEERIKAANRPQVAAEFLAETSNHQWYFNWNSHRDLRKLLQKKQLMLSY